MFPLLYTHCRELLLIWESLRELERKGKQRENHRIHSQHKHLLTIHNITASLTLNIIARPKYIVERQISILMNCIRL